jgi:hypothetical protein
MYDELLHGDELHATAIPETALGSSVDRVGGALTHEIPNTAHGTRLPKWELGNPRPQILCLSLTDTFINGDCSIHTHTSTTCMFRWMREVRKAYQILVGKQQRGCVFCVVRAKLL